MDIKEIISSAGRNRHTIILEAREEDGSVETREAEPYSYRFKNGHELFFCYDIVKQGTRSFIVSNILSVEETNNIFTPRWTIEV
ncbi:MAG: WYL domain-containing protein [Sulfurovum sp.]